MTKTRRLIWHAAIVSLTSLLPAMARAEDPPTLAWIQQFGTDKHEAATGVDFDHLGNVFVSGYTFTLPSTNDGWLSKFDSSGNRLWTTDFSGRPEGVAVDGLGNAFVTHNLGDIPAPGVKKFDSLGNLLWARQLPIPRSAANAIAVDDLGNPYITGGANADAFVTKYDSEGDLLWTGQFVPTETQDVGRDISVDSQGNAYITGVINGVNGGPNARPHDAFVAKYDAGGNLLWTRELATSASDFGNAISVDGLGNVFVAGTTRGSLGGPIQGELDAFVAKYDELGNLHWIRQLGDEQINGATVDNLGNVVVSGHRAGDISLAKYDAAGELFWSHQFNVGLIGGAQNAVVTDKLGRIYLAGGPIGGEADAYLARFDQAAVPEPATSVLAGLAGVWTVSRLRRRN